MPTGRAVATIGNAPSMPSVDSTFWAELRKKPAYFRYASVPRLARIASQSTAFRRPGDAARWIASPKAWFASVDATSRRT